MNVTTVSFPFPAADYYFDQPWTLDGVTYILTFHYNTRAANWFLAIADANASPIVSGLALHSGRNLLAAYSSRPLPKGALFVYDATGNDNDPGPDSFTSTHTLYYGILS